jgi:hypothetical protein
LPYVTTIGDVRIVIEEIYNPPLTLGATEFEIYDTKVVLRNGSVGIAGVIAPRLVPFVFDMVAAAANVAAPLFGPLFIDLSKSVFRQIGAPATSGKESSRIEIGLLPWWSLRLWNYSPGILPLRLRVGFVIAGPIRDAGASVRGVVRYRVSLTAETGRLLQHIRPTGHVTIIPIEFDIQWTG